MTTQRALVLNAVETKLNAISGPGKSRNRDTEVDPSEYPHIAMYDGGHVVLPQNAGSTVYRVRFDVEGYVTSADADGLATAIDAQYENILTAIIDPADPLLSVGSVRDVREMDMGDPDILNEGQSNVAAAFRVGFEIDFETAEGDPTVAG